MSRGLKRTRSYGKYGQDNLFTGLGRGPTKRARIENSLPIVQQQAVASISKRTAKRILTANSDKKATQYYSTLLSVTSLGGAVSLTPNLKFNDSSLDGASGEKIIPTGITFNWIWDFTTIEAETGSTYSSGRFILLQERGYPQGATAWGNYMRADITSNHQLDLVLKSNDRNWTMLWDSGPMSAVSTTGYVAGGNQLVRTGSITIPKRMLRPIFLQSGDEEDAAVVQKNRLICTYVSDSSLAPHPTFSFEVEVAYTDGA